MQFKQTLQELEGSEGCQQKAGNTSRGHEYAHYMPIFPLQFTNGGFNKQEFSAHYILWPSFK